MVKGPAAITTGPYTVGGAINMISTPIPDEQSGMVNLETGSDGNMKAHFHYGNSTDNFGFLVEGLKHETDGFDEIEHTGGDTGFDKDDILVKLRLNSDPNEDIYHQFDFKYQDLSDVPNDTLVFFDDHQNHLERMKEAKFFGIKHIIFEDNYPSNRGDFFTIPVSYTHLTLPTKA